jgi:hypothetical protein
VAGEVNDLSVLRGREETALCCVFSLQADADFIEGLHSTRFLCRERQIRKNSGKALIDARISDDENGGVRRLVANHQFPRGCKVDRGARRYLHLMQLDEMPTLAIYQRGERYGGEPLVGNEDKRISASQQGFDGLNEELVKRTAEGL